MRKLLKIARDVVLVLAGLAVIGFLGTIAARLAYPMLVDPGSDIAVIEIHNRSGAPIEEVTATLCGHELRAVRIDPGGEAAMRFRLACREGDLRVRLGSGRAFSYPGLRIASGEHRHVRFTITADQIRHQAGPVSETDLAAGRR